MNHTEIVKIVSEGIQQALAEQYELVQATEHANAVQTPNLVQDQLTEMRNAVAQLQQAMLVTAANPRPPQTNPQPFQYPTMVDPSLYPNPQMLAWNPFLMA